jgi:RND family efflux transporter MFP subunit
MRRLSSALLAFGLLSGVTASALAEPVAVETVRITEWKAVYGTVEARDRIPARARLGGTLVELLVIEGDAVTAGQELARIVDDKLDLQLQALAARREALTAQLANAEADLKRGEDLLKDGVITAQRIDALRTGVDVLKGQNAALEAEADVIRQQAKEGVVLAPLAGRVLDVPVAEGAVALPGEIIAVIGGGGTFLRIAVPERHATALDAGDSIRITGPDGDREGRLARVYPLVEGGRVVADVEIDGLPDRHVGTRMLVSLPVGDRPAILVPEDSITTRAGLDFVGIQTDRGIALRSIVPGRTHTVNGVPMVEVISGLRAGDVVVPAADVASEASHD